MGKSIHRLIERIRARDLKATIELLEIKDPSTIDELLRYLTDQNEYVRSYVSIALSCYCIPKVKEALVALLSDNNPLARKGAIDTLILMKAKDSLPEIVLLEEDDDEGVKISVRRAKKLL